MLGKVFAIDGLQHHYFTLLDFLIMSLCRWGLPRGLEPGETGVVFIVLLGGLLLGRLLLAGRFLPRHGELFCLGRDPCINQ